MQVFRRTGVLALAGALAAVLAGAALAGTASPAVKIVTFKGKYAGTATTKITDNIADIAATGTGLGTLIGKSKVTGKGKGDTGQQPCVPFNGLGSLANATGTKLNFQVLPSSQGCGDEGGHVFSLNGRAKILSGTKAYKGAKGTLKLTGVYDRDQGTFSITFTGKITLPK